MTRVFGLVRRVALATLLLALAGTHVIVAGPASASTGAQLGPCGSAPCPDTPPEGPCGPNPCPTIPADVEPCPGGTCSTIPADVEPCANGACDTIPAEVEPCANGACDTIPEGQDPCGPDGCPTTPVGDESCGPEACPVFGSATTRSPLPTTTVTRAGGQAQPNGAAARHTGARGGGPDAYGVGTGGIFGLIAIAIAIVGALVWWRRSRRTSRQ